MVIDLIPYRLLEELLEHFLHAGELKYFTYLSIDLYTASLMIAKAKSCVCGGNPHKPRNGRGQRPCPRALLQEAV